MFNTYFPVLPMLNTSRCFLRKFEMSDASDMYYYASDNDVTKYVLWPPHESLDGTKGYIDILIDGYQKNNICNWAIVSKEENKVIGSIGLVSCSVKDRKCEIGYVISKDYWNKGIATEVLLRVLKFCFNVMDMNRVEARHITGNIASGRVMEKCNMSLEGIERESIFCKGKYRDLKRYAILKKDFEDNRPYIP